MDNININHQLNEDTAEDLERATWSSIKARVKSQNIKSQYLGCDDNGRLYFRTNSGTKPGVYYNQQIEFVNLKEGIQMLNQKLSVRKRAVLKMLMKGDIRLWCEDASFHYFAKYVAWKNGYGLQKEIRAPRRNNVQQDHITCKHLQSCLYLLPNISEQILADYKRHKILPSFATRLRNKLRGSSGNDDSEE